MSSESEESIGFQQAATIEELNRKIDWLTKRVTEAERKVDIMPIEKLFDGFKRELFERIDKLVERVENSVERVDNSVESASNALHRAADLVERAFIIAEQSERKSINIVFDSLGRIH